MLLIVISWFSNPRHNLNVRTLFRWIFWLWNQGYFATSTLMQRHGAESSLWLMMACYTPLSHLVTSERHYVCTKYIPMQITQMSIFTLQKTYTSYTKSLHYTNFTNLRFKKRSFISLSLAQVKSCVSKTST